MIQHWSEEELDLLKSNKSNEEISNLTGRTVMAVRTKRYKYTGHYVEEDEWSDCVPRLISLSLTQEEKTERIKIMAAQMRIKLKGENV